MSIPGDFDRDADVVRHATIRGVQSDVGDGQECVILTLALTMPVGDGEAFVAAIGDLISDLGYQINAKLVD